MSDLWTRREFNRTIGLTLLGGIFVPKFGRWFRPNEVMAASGPPVFVGQNTMVWPAHRAGDVALLVSASANPVTILTPGWERLYSGRPGGSHGGSHYLVYWSRAGSNREPAPRLRSKGARTQQILTFRGVSKGHHPVGLTTECDIEHPGLRASLQTVVVARA